jgi:dipeptide transport system ATP-binding protein
LFSPRCTFATEHCRSVEPLLAPENFGRARCHYPLQEGEPTGMISVSESAA